ncbi:MAG: ester cyclase [Chloroflexi bacterium]|nr:MAG: ester cyclase [Chloroflexota bacterium]
MTPRHPPAIRRGFPDSTGAESRPDFEPSNGMEERQMGTLKEKVYRLNAAVNDHDLNPIGDMYAADAELVWPGLGPTKGREAVVGFYATLLGAFPDVHVTIKRILEEGDAVAIQYVSEGTHTGPLPMPTGELPPTNRRFTIEASSFGLVDANGLIKTQREYFDQVEILAQLGSMPAPA